MAQTPLRAGLVGASGFTGAELFRLLAGHPAIDVAVATADTMAGRSVGELYPSLYSVYGDLELTPFDASALSGLDVVFLGLPHAASMELAPQIIGDVGVVVDLSAAYRLKDPSRYDEFYGFAHTQLDLLDEAVYGLPERHRADLVGARLVATPGCHVTAATLALAPLVDAGLIATDGVVVNNVTGITGAGRTPTETNIFTSIDSNATPYGLLHHRHTPEIEQEVGAQVIFTPHLVPMSRGILASCYARPATALSPADLTDALRTAYDAEPFVTVLDGPPATKSVLGSNTAHVSATFDERTSTVLAFCAIDNLTKGASGGALQSANVALGLDERLGLAVAGLAP